MPAGEALRPIDLEPLELAPKQGRRSSPTPPPWWIDPQVVPEAQLNNAFSSGQSVTASEPSRIASVSRLGTGTEPGPK
jgi:hypothetical protein